MSILNALIEPDLIKKVMDLKNKNVVGDEIKNLWIHIKELTETVCQLVAKNDKLNTDLVILKTV